MTAQLLAGAPVAEAVLEDVAKRVEALAARGRSVGLGTVLVGDDEASAGYVRKKHETCAQLGIASTDVHIPADADPGELPAAVERLNADDAVDAYLIQYPVAEGFDFDEAVNMMEPDKDADGLHPANLGRLVLQQDGPVPCTPAGIRAMFVHYGIDIRGKDVVVVGRGPTLGRPLALLLSAKAPGANAAVTVVHSAVDDIAAHTRRADVVIAAVGSPSVVTADMVRPGAVVVSGGLSWEGRRLLPDVDEDVAEVASWITPRLGGVGPTTVAMLLRNTVAAAEARAGREAV
jgi:methylenetetrahydrofolate dehydrogenase (NADP+) / methenyltetrahydrofolate cyclohydrolase